MTTQRAGAGVLALIVLLLTATASAQDTSMVPVKVDGETVRLEMRIYKPATPNAAPTLVFNHGSTGSGRNSAIFTRSLDFPALARFFVARGWAVVMPMRRGRGGSEGLYDEGFATDRVNGYACDPALSIPGADRALRDIEAAMDAIVAMPFVDKERVVIGGQSRGGILSVAYAGGHPGQVKGVINFVGGWLGERCWGASDVNATLMKRGARYPGEMIWLYGDRDPFYSLQHSRGNFAAFQTAGGRGAFLEFPPPPESDGHRISGYPEIWKSDLENYLTRLGLPAGTR